MNPPPASSCFLSTTIHPSIIDTAYPLRVCVGAGSSPCWHRVRGGLWPWWVVSLLQAIQPFREMPINPSCMEEAEIPRENRQRYTQTKPVFEHFVLCITTPPFNKGKKYIYIYSVYINQDHIVPQHSHILKSLVAEATVLNNVNPSIHYPYRLSFEGQGRAGAKPS